MSRPHDGVVVVGRLDDERLIDVAGGGMVSPLELRQLAQEIIDRRAEGRRKAIEAQAILTELDMELAKACPTCGGVTRCRCTMAPRAARSVR